LRRGFFCKEITMTIEVLVDENGTILALSTAHEGKEPARRRAREQRDEGIYKVDVPYHNPYIR
jgi:hypothetical protein